MTPEIERLKNSPLEFAKKILKQDKIFLTPFQDKLLEELISKTGTQFAYRCGRMPRSSRFHSDLIVAMACAAELKDKYKYKEDAYRVRVRGEFVKAEEAQE